MRIVMIMPVLILYLAVAIATDGPIDATGEVRVPLEEYTKLLEQTRDEPRPAPAAYAIGRSEVAVRVDEVGERLLGEVRVELDIRIFEAEWTLVPLLPAGVAVREALQDGQPVQLVQNADGLHWSGDTAGVVTLQLTYGLEPKRSDAGYVMALPIARAATTTLEVELPGTRLDVAVIPGDDYRVSEDGGRTRVEASVPAEPFVTLTWRKLSERPYAISRAEYTGELVDDALAWQAELALDVFDGGVLKIPLMSAGVALSSVELDGEPLTLLEEAGRFQALVQGRGRRALKIAFQVPVERESGPPRAVLSIPRLPISHFSLDLPGQKELELVPATHVDRTVTDERTETRFFIPPTERVEISWTEAVPAALEVQARANASLYHAVWAEEGVLHIDALARYEITRGETSVLRLTLPEAAQVNRIEATGVGVSDWALSEAGEGERNLIEVYLDRAVDGELELEIAYEQLLDASAATSVPIPLLRASDVNRQRGMLALLAGPELTLRPVDEERITRVGENQLPADFRNGLDKRIAHTFKYTASDPLVAARAEVPERVPGRYDAAVDTLISIGEVTLTGSAGVTVDVKSGSITSLTLVLPASVNPLGVTAPSLRSHKVRPGESGEDKRIDLEFTREMEGQFRIDVQYEHILDDLEGEVGVPTLAVVDAEVEHGRIAVEALAAVEVRAASADQLSSVEIDELPRQLVLKTTNPILLAYKYVHTDPPYRLALRVTRHKEIDVQVAVIDQARYRTLYTSEGLAVTTAHFAVRNTRRQFLRLALPEGSRVWSASVGGEAVKPARAEGTDNAVLVRMINSTTGFPVQVIYASQGEPLRTWGGLEDRLPSPDMIVTETRWDVYLPDDFDYFGLDSNLRLAASGPARPVVDADVPDLAASGLKLNVPAAGWSFHMTKLYANQGDQGAWFSVQYLRGSYYGLGVTIGMMIAVLIVVAGASRMIGERQTTTRAAGAVLILVGGGLIVFGVAYLGANPLPPAALGAMILVIWLITVFQAERRRRAEEAEEKRRALQRGV